MSGEVNPPTDVKPVVSSVILDGSAVVNMLKPVNIKSFNEYALKVFIPYIQNIGKDVQRIDIVFDTYIDNSLKASTRGKRGKGIRRRVQDETNVPGNWQEFLRLDENKIELFHFLADKITSAGIDNEIVVTDKINALGNTAEHSYELLSPFANPGMPSPDLFGWQKLDGTWVPFWSVLAEASMSCQELIHCGCKKGCRGACKCLKAALKCTALCKCSPDCERETD
ncbi:unnamed protein product [Mytilus edulis]|uniref:Tesmin/TSO1-like CXC domain-containing protein n=1 Tax=Mytilus edulis TaxID=6550 RepID=A0A8S3VKR7_MYTED|nr:unnamed protein product [Mytilus edulis]